MMTSSCVDSSVAFIRLVSTQASTLLGLLWAEIAGALSGVAAAASAAAAVASRASIVRASGARVASVARGAGKRARGGAPRLRPPPRDFNRISFTCVIKKYKTQS